MRESGHALRPPGQSVVRMRRVILKATGDYWRVLRGLRRRDNWLADAAKLLAFTSSASQTLGQLTHVELVHLIFQGTQRNSKILCGRSDVPSALFECTKNEVPLERVGGFLEQAFALRAQRLELCKME